MISPPRRAARWTAVACCLVLIAATLEGAGYAALDLFSARYPLLFAFDLDDFLAGVRSERLRAHADTGPDGATYAYDRGLGWIRTPERSIVQPHGIRMTTDALGSRVTGPETGPLWMATYGDSFTEGLEVEDADTWQAYLSRRYRARVLNFGVSGYGPDQALLYLERNLARGVTAPVVVLAMIDENRNRIVNDFPLFYNYPNVGMYMAFKPRFVPAAAGFRVRSFMPDDMTDLEAVRAAARAASRADPFFALRTEHFAFPYSLNAARFLWHYGPKPWMPWPGDSDEAWAVLGHIVDRLVVLSRERGFAPVLALLPQSVEEIRGRAGRPHELLSALLAEHPHPGLLFVDVVQALSGPDAGQLVPDFDVDAYIARTHPSATGDAAIAAVIGHAVVAAGHGPPGASAAR